MNEKKLKEWDEQGNPENLINEGLVSSELEVIINCEKAQLKITASDGEALRRVLKLTDAILSENKK